MLFITDYKVIACDVISKKKPYGGTHTIGLDKTPRALVRAYVSFRLRTSAKNSVVTPCVVLTINTITDMSKYLL